jgi:hypothetical protein
MRGEFPMPFGGIDTVIPLTPWQFKLALEYLTDPRGCGHVHNFAVEMDHSVAQNHAPRIWTTKLGAECVQRILAVSEPNGS